MDLVYVSYSASRWLSRHRLAPAAPCACCSPATFPMLPASVRIPSSHTTPWTSIHPRAVIGPGCHIGHGVTIGGRKGIETVPVLGRGVAVGCGATILGPINIGDGAMIGAGAVVIHDVPAGATVAGVPARIIKEKAA